MFVEPGLDAQPLGVVDPGVAFGHLALFGVPRRVRRQAERGGVGRRFGRVHRRRRRRRRRRAVGAGRRRFGRVHRHPHVAARLKALDGARRRRRRRVSCPSRSRSNQRWSWFRRNISLWIPIVRCFFFVSQWNTLKGLRELDNYRMRRLKFTWWVRIWWIDSLLKPLLISYLNSIQEWVFTLKVHLLHWKYAG